MFKVIIHRKALSEIRSLPSKDKMRILDAIRNMESDPFLGDIKPIKALKGVFRKRVGDYRLLSQLILKWAKWSCLKLVNAKNFMKNCKTSTFHPNSRENTMISGFKYHNKRRLILVSMRCIRTSLFECAQLLQYALV